MTFAAARFGIFAVNSQRRCVDSSNRTAFTKIIYGAGLAFAKLPVREFGFQIRRSNWHENATRTSQ